MISSEILNWGYRELKEFINNPIVIENDRYEFKSTYKLATKRLRKHFSAFANSNGGFIFFGIDKNKNIAGVEEDIEIDTVLNRALNNENLQPPIEKWELVKAICINQSRPAMYVYIYYVYPSLFVNRPHVSDEKVYIRQNGESKPITSGIELRRRFFISKFYPEHIGQLEFELEKIRDYQYKGSELDSVYYKNLGQYLEEILKELKKNPKEILRITEVNNLLSQYKAVKRLIDEVNTLKVDLHLSTGIAPLSNPLDIESKYDNLKNIVDDFIIKFKRFHNL
jgi:hypothetical protein